MTPQPPMCCKQGEITSVHNSSDRPVGGNTLPQDSIDATSFNRTASKVGFMPVQNDGAGQNCLQAVHCLCTYLFWPLNLTGTHVMMMMASKMATYCLFVPACITMRLTQAQQSQLCMSRALLLPVTCLHWIAQAAWTDLLMALSTLSMQMSA